MWSGDPSGAERDPNVPHDTNKLLHCTFILRGISGEEVMGDENVVLYSCFKVFSVLISHVRVDCCNLWKQKLEFSALQEWCWSAREQKCENGNYLYGQ